jgi:hypothetical protein
VPNEPVVRVASIPGCIIQCSVVRTVERVETAASLQDGHASLLREMFKKGDEHLSRQKGKLECLCRFFCSVFLKSYPPLHGATTTEHHRLMLVEDACSQPKCETV